eukprot:3941755-Prymnesium_polylepis.1
MGRASQDVGDHASRRAREVGQIDEKIARVSSAAVVPCGVDGARAVAPQIDPVGLRASVGSR